MKQQNGNHPVTKRERVSLTFNPKQIKIIESLVGELGDNKADVVKSIFMSWLSEKGITPAIVKKNLELP